MLKVIEEVLNNIAALSTILGFGLFGVAVAIGSCYRRIRGVIFAWRDRNVLQEDYEFFKTLAIRDGAFAPNALRLVYHLDRRKREIKINLDRVLQEQLSGKLQRRASGSTYFTYADIITSPDCFLPLSFIDEQTQRPFSLADLIQSMQADKYRTATSARRTPLQRNRLLVGPAGWGKSLTCLAIEHTLLEATLQGDTRWPYLLTPEDFWHAAAIVNPDGQASLGSLAWCLRLLMERLHCNEISELQRRLLTDYLANDALIIIDGFDEIAERLGRTQTQVLLHSWVFERALLVTSRTSFYASQLYGSTCITNHPVIGIQAPAPEFRQTFIANACARLYGTAANERSAAILNLLHLFPTIDAIARTPLILMMLTEIDVSQHRTATQVDKVSIYEAFVRQIVDRDAHRLNVFSADDIKRAYQRIAWSIFAKSSRLDRPISMLDLTELRTVLIDLGAAATDREVTLLEDILVASPLIMAAGKDRLSPVGLRIGFSHESFMEFHIAKRLFLWLIGQTEHGADFFAYIDTPEVSVFLKEYLVRLESDPELKRCALGRLCSNLERLLVERDAASDESSARMKSFAAGQTAYYLGMIADGEVVTRLQNIAASDRDFWVCRAAAIGLAFGGYPQTINRFIDTMTRAIEQGDFSLARKNIAIELGFYGDQRFDPLDPTFDTGGSTCRRLVTRVCQELIWDIESPNWRMGLFNLLYLAKFRPASQDSFVQVFAECQPVVINAMNCIERTVGLEHFPEIHELRRFLDSRALDPVHYSGGEPLFSVPTHFTNSPTNCEESERLA